MPEVEISLTRVSAPEEYARAISILKTAFHRGLLEVLQQSDGGGVGATDQLEVVPGASPEPG